MQLFTCDQTKMEKDREIKFSTLHYAASTIESAIHGNHVKQEPKILIYHHLKHQKYYYKNLSSPKTPLLLLLFKNGLPTGFDHHNS